MHINQYNSLTISQIERLVEGDENKVFKDGYFSMQKGLPTQSKQIYKGFLLSAGFLFSTKEFVDTVPYDPHLYFVGDDTSVALRSFTIGFDIFHIPKIPLFHSHRGKFTNQSNND